MRAGVSEIDALGGGVGRAAADVRLQASRVRAGWGGGGFAERGGEILDATVWGRGGRACRAESGRGGVTTGMWGIDLLGRQAWGGSRSGRSGSLPPWQAGGRGRGSGTPSPRRAARAGRRPPPLPPPPPPASLVSPPVLDPDAGLRGTPRHPLLLPPPRMFCSFAALWTRCRFGCCVLVAPPPPLRRHARSAGCGSNVEPLHVAPVLPPHLAGGDCRVDRPPPAA